MKNREIKFRFWNHIVGRMTEKSYTLEELYKEKVNFTDLIPLRFTGLHDKVGVEIYEGDIVKQFGNPKSFTVEFFNSAWRAHRLYILGTEIKPEAIEVIGNIYQTAHSEIGKDGER
jgi:hypothetical protein